MPFKIITEIMILKISQINDLNEIKQILIRISLTYYSIERDAQLLANRIALLKQEEMKTWKKIEETKKRTNDITGLKKRNEERVQKVSQIT